MSDETYNGYSNRETWAFNLHWSNDQGLYNETLDMARDFIDGQTVEDPDREVTDSELGEWAVMYWKDMIEDYEEGYGVPAPPALAMFYREVGSWWRIDYAEVGASVRESLGIEAD